MRPRTGKNLCRPSTREVPANDPPSTSRKQKNVVHDALWALASATGVFPAVAMPSPVRVASAFGVLVASGELPRHVAVSLARVLEGSAAAAALGVGLGIAMGLSPRIDRTIDLLLQLLRPIPIREKVRLAKRYVKVFGFFMIGIPGEQLEDVEQTFALARELDLDRWTWSIYSPLPGSALFDELVRERKVPERLDYGQVHYTEAYEGVSAIAPAKLKDLYREINEYFYQRTAARRAPSP